MPRRRRPVRDRHELGEDAPVLGRRMHVHGVVLYGVLSEGDWRDFIAAGARLIGMSPVGDPACWHYPVDGKGGVGFTLVQPVTESFLALDVWPEHGAAYLFICSCKPFDPSVLLDAMDGGGLMSGETHSTVLGLDA